jgi:uncharacterized protein
MLGKEDFKPVTLADRVFFEHHYALYPQIHSSNTFTNMVCWKHFVNYRYAYVNGNVIIASTTEGVTRFRPPIGPRDPALMRALLQLALAEGDETPLVLIDSETAQWMYEIDPKLVLVPDRDHFDYVYSAADLAELPGKHYVKIRSQIHKFRKNYRYNVEPITPGNQKELIDFLEKWCELKGCDSDSFLAHEIEATSYAIEHLSELSLQGLLIRVESHVEAISLFERLNEDTAVIHFEKGMTEYEGIYKAVNAETAEVLAGKVKYINRESDLGVEGLREAKMRYHPHHMVEVYLLKR